MKRGPQRSVNRTHQSVKSMRAAWGEDAPNWIKILAKECDRSSQRRVAETIGYSPAAVSSVINKRYRGDLTAVKQAVRGAFMSTVLVCPVLGTISTQTCLAWQKRAGTFINTNPLSVRMFGACRTCPKSRSQKREEKHVESKT